jgi:hypothetical protein
MVSCVAVKKWLHETAKINQLGVKIFMWEKHEDVRRFYKTQPLLVSGAMRRG